MKNARNAVRCLRCDVVVESKHRHDYNSCLCGHVAVDGGHSYKRRVFRGEPEWNEIDADGVETKGGER